MSTNPSTRMSADNSPIQAAQAWWWYRRLPGLDEGARCERARTSPRCQQGKPRSLVLVDLENVVGLPPRQITRDAAQVAFEEVTRLAHFDVGSDLLVVAVNPNLAFLAHSVAPGARLKTRHGENGADLCLVEELSDLRLLRERFGRVVVASGDGIFAEPVAAARAGGIEAVVLSRRAGLSRRLRLAAHEARYLGDSALQVA